MENAKYYLTFSGEVGSVHGDSTNPRYLNWLD
jgi:hypothetical protein